MAKPVTRLHSRVKEQHTVPPQRRGLHPPVEPPAAPPGTVVHVTIALRPGDGAAEPAELERAVAERLNGSWVQVLGSWVQMDVLWAQMDVLGCEPEAAWAGHPPA